MLIQQRRERERAQYKGLAWRTVIQTIWLVLSAIVAYLIIQFLLTAELISYGGLRGRLAIPNWLPDWALLAGMILFFVVVMQFFFILGYVVISPLGRVRPGRPSLRKSTVDPLEDNQYQHR